MTYLDQADIEPNTTDEARSAGAIIPVPLPTVMSPLLKRHRYALKGDVYESTQLVPVAALEEFVPELRRACMPAKEEEVRLHAMLLVGAYPRREMDDPDIYVCTLCFDPQEFPADIIQDACAEVRRTVKFFPSISEVYQIAQKLMNERTGRLRVAEQMLAEHERREVERRQEAERKRRWREDRERLHASVVEAFGDDAPRPGDFDVALHELEDGEVGEFNRAYRALETLGDRALPAPGAPAACARRWRDGRDRHQRASLRQASRR